MRQSLSSNKRRGREYQLKKRGIKDDFIDKQVLAIHQAMAKKLIEQPQLVEKAKHTLEQRKQAGKLTYSAYITWLSILDFVDDAETFQNAILENSDKMKRLRRQTPLVGILTEEERQAALYNDAIGEITNTDVLFL